MHTSNLIKKEKCKTFLKDMDIIFHTNDFTDRNAWPHAVWLTTYARISVDSVARVARHFRYRIERCISGIYTAMWNKLAATVWNWQSVHKECSGVSTFNVYISLYHWQLLESLIHTTYRWVYRQAHPTMNHRLGRPLQSLPRFCSLYSRRLVLLCYTPYSHRFSSHWQQQEGRNLKNENFMIRSDEHMPLKSIYSIYAKFHHTPSLQDAHKNTDNDGNELPETRLAYDLISDCL